MKTTFHQDNDLIAFCNRGYEHETFKLGVKFYPYKEKDPEETKEILPLLYKEIDNSPQTITWSSM